MIKNADFEGPLIFSAHEFDNLELAPEQKAQQDKAIGLILGLRKIFGETDRPRVPYQHSLACRLLYEFERLQMQPGGPAYEDFERLRGIWQRRNMQLLLSAAHLAKWLAHH